MIYQVLKAKNHQAQQGVMVLGAKRAVDSAMNLMVILVTKGKLRGNFLKLFKTF